jgi:hypothetical protein
MLENRRISVCAGFFMHLIVQLRSPHNNSFNRTRN